MRLQPWWWCPFLTSYNHNFWWQWQTCKDPLGRVNFFFFFSFLNLVFFYFFIFFLFIFFLSPRVCLYRIGQNKSEWDRRFRSAAKALHFLLPPLSLLHITHHHSPFLPNFKNLLIIIYFFYLYLKIFVIFFFPLLTI